MSQAATIEVSGSLWLGDAEDPMNNAPVLEGADVSIAVERTDDNEVAIHATLPGDNNAVITLYVSQVAGLAMSKLLERETLRDF